MEENNLHYLGPYNRKERYQCQKYYSRLTDSKSLKEVYGDDYNPFWDLDYDLNKHIRGSSDLEKPVDKEENGTNGKAGEVGMIHLDHERHSEIDGVRLDVDDPLLRGEQAVDDVSDEGSSTSSWVEMDALAEGADPIELYFTSERKKSLQGIESIKDEILLASNLEVWPKFADKGELERINLLKAEYLSRMKKLFGDKYIEHIDADVKSLLKDELTIEGKSITERDEWDEDGRKSSNIRSRVTSVFEIKSQRLSIQDVEIEKHYDESFEKCLREAIGEVRKESSIDEKINELDKLGEEGGQPLTMQETDECNEHFMNIMNMADAKSEEELGESIPSEGSTPSNVTSEYLAPSPTTSASSSDEFDDKYAEYEDLEEYFQNNAAARRYPIIEKYSSDESVPEECEIGEFESEIDFNYIDQFDEEKSSLTFEEKEIEEASTKIILESKEKPVEEEERLGEID